MKKTLLYIIPVLCLAAGASVFIRQYDKSKPLSKEAFFAKYHITGETLIPADFNFEECKKAISAHTDEKFAEQFIKDIKAYLLPPELFDGFYPVREKVIFYDEWYPENLIELGFTKQEIAKFNLAETEEKEQARSDYEVTRKEFERQKAEGKLSVNDDRAIGLIGRVGENIYIRGLFGRDLWILGQTTELIRKENTGLKNYRADINLGECRPAAGYENQTYPKAYECDIFTGYNTGLIEVAKYYPPLSAIVEKYLSIYQDYVSTYIQKPDEK